MIFIKCIITIDDHLIPFNYFHQICHSHLWSFSYFLKYIWSPRGCDQQSRWSTSPPSWSSSSPLRLPLQEPKSPPWPSLPWNRGWYFIKEKLHSHVGVVSVVYSASLNHQEETIGCLFKPLQGSSGHLCQTWLLGAPFDLVVHVGQREETKHLYWWLK